MPRRDPDKTGPSTPKLSADTVTFWHALTPDERYREYDEALTELRSAVLEENRYGARGLRGGKSRGAALATAVYKAHAAHAGRSRAIEVQHKRELQMAQEGRLWREEGVAMINGKRWAAADLPASMIAMQTRFHGPRISK